MTCLKMIREWLAPIDLEASIYSFVFTEMTALREILAKVGTEKMPIAIITLTMPGPSTLTIYSQDVEHMQGIPINALLQRVHLVEFL